ncbi:hypothetical protein [Pontiella desulfatans]|uniref:hypothetical protein n=1 Tax=Pontiella desulfatans TaxID=2750659 RepID=UPI00109C3239|nr:hypothetical protein [Pontiella desulfatans]
MRRELKGHAALKTGAGGFATGQLNDKTISVRVDFLNHCARTGNSPVINRPVKSLRPHRESFCSKSICQNPAQPGHEQARKPAPHIGGRGSIRAAARFFRGGADAVRPGARRAPSKASQVLDGHTIEQQLRAKFTRQDNGMTGSLDDRMILLARTENRLVINRPVKNRHPHMVLIFVHSRAFAVLLYAVAEVDVGRLKT